MTFLKVFETSPSFLFEQKDFYSAEEYVTNLDEALWEKRPPDFICVCADFR